MHRFGTPENYTIRASGNSNIYTVIINNIFGGFGVTPSKLINITINFRPSLRINGEYLTFGHVSFSINYSLMEGNMCIPVIGSDNNLYFFRVNSYTSIPTADDPSLSFNFSVYTFTSAGVFSSLLAQDAQKLPGLDVIILEEA